MRILQCCAGGLWSRPLTNELRRLGHEVVLGDHDKEGAAWDGEYVYLPRATHRDEFYDAVRDAEVDLVIPHVHEEAIALAPYGIAALPPEAVLYNTHDKSLFYRLCEQVSPARVKWELAHMSAPDGPAELNGEYVMKPRAGSASRYVVRSRTFPGDYIFMEELKGPEYTVDIVAWRGVPITYCIRERRKAHGGVCVDTVIHGPNVPGCDDIDHYLERFCRYFGWHGPAALQFFLVEAKNRPTAPFWTDCNARFGGGVGFSIMAGWDGVACLLNLVEGRQATPKSVKWEAKRYRRWYVEEEV